MDVNASAWGEAQVDVIGCLMIEPRLHGEIFHRVRAEDFGDTSLRHIFEAAAALFTAGHSVDSASVAAAAGDAYVQDIRRCMELTPTTASCLAYCAALREQARLHAMRDIGLQLMDAPTLDAAREALEGAEQLLSGRQDVRVVSFSQGLVDFLTRMDSKTPARYHDWGIRQLNERLYVSPGDLVILGAFPSVGKTVLGMQFALAAARTQRVGVFSLETSDRKLYDRLIAQTARIDFERIKQGTLTPEDIREACDLGKVVDKIRLDVIDAAGMTVQDVRGITLARKYEFIVIDYVQLLQGRGKTRFDVVTETSMALRTLAQTAGVTVLALSQLTRPAQGERSKAPRMSALRESGQLEQDADVIMFLSLANDEDYSSDRWLKVAKNKDGEHGSLCLRFDSRHMEFVPTDSRRFSPPLRKQALPKPVFAELPDQEVIPFESR